MSAAADVVAVPIRFDAVAANSFRAISTDIVRGQVVRVMYAIAEQRDAFWDIVTGQHAPARGRVSLGGADLYALPLLRRIELFRDIGVMPHDGGLISNLKVWENIVLPARYHDSAPIAELEQPVAGWLRELGLDERAMRELLRRLPEQLHAGERAIVSAVRALLMEPDIMIYSAPFSEIERELAARLLQVMMHYQRARRERVALFLLPDEPFSGRVPADVTLVLES